jgi:hypothetical protein
MKFNNSIKIFIIWFIIILCLYILYFSAQPMHEGLINEIDGKKQPTTVDDFSFYLTNIQDFEKHNYMGVDASASYTTFQDNKQRLYPSREDFEMELKNLPPIQDVSNVPVSVIKTYLTHINRFYEKQFANMTGPRTHTVPQTLQFDNNGISIKSNTFFVYDNSSNNSYDCQESITGNKKFKYCGPPALYTEFRP